MNGRSLIFSVGILLSQLVWANNETGASVSVMDSNIGKPMTDAIIKIIPLEERDRKGKELMGIADKNGNFNYLFSEPVIIQVSHLGYNTITDTLMQPVNKVYKMFTGSQDIKDVVVTAQYSPNAIQKSVYEVKVISQEELKAKGANNLREALQTKLNIDLSQDAVYGSTLGINGISGEGVKIMVDGIPLVVPFGIPMRPPIPPS